MKIGQLAKACRSKLIRHLFVKIAKATLDNSQDLEQGSYFLTQCMWLSDSLPSS